MSTVPVDQNNEGRLSLVLNASERLVMARSVEEVVAVLRDTARAAVGAEGIAVVIEDEGRCSYVAEDAVSPLWQGQTFQADQCISGWAMHHRETVAIRDVRIDPRIPQDAYAATFVRSLVMVPIGRPVPVAALGAYVIQQELMITAAEDTYTFRNAAHQTALPIREYGSFLLGTGVGGSGAHWSGLTWRYNPTDFQLRSHLTERYGAHAIPKDLLIRDWGVTYNELEPYYDKFEKMAGIGGKAGVLNGAYCEGGNPFEGNRSSEFPLPPMPMTYAPTLFAEAAKTLGMRPFPTPSGNASQAYTNPYGVTMGPCTYCGYCSRCGCATIPNPRLRPTSSQH